jgi:Icc-related predicted phosphoesterase
MKLAWSTDPHFDFCERGEVIAFIESLGVERVDGLLITGDIGVRPLKWLEMIMQNVRVPVYAVCGNHDFYESSILAMRHAVTSLEYEFGQFMYLTAQTVPIILSPKTALIGHDGWGDGGYGNILTTPISIKDHQLIQGLKGCTNLMLQGRLAEQGRIAAGHVRTMLLAALVTHEHIILAMHVPPFEEACRFEGEVASTDWLPFMGCKAVGDVILELMGKNLKHRLDVYCGHTHHAYVYSPLPNVRITVGGARYGEPMLQQTILVS